MTAGFFGVTLQRFNEAKGFGCSMKYVLITPAHNDTGFIEKTVASMVVPNAVTFALGYCRRWLERPDCGGSSEVCQTVSWTTTLATTHFKLSYSSCRWHEKIPKKHTLAAQGCTVHQGSTGATPPRERLLAKMPQRSICAEIGVHEGDFSQDILCSVKPVKLHLIDPWSI